MSRKIKRIEIFLYLEQKQLEIRYFPAYNISFKELLKHNRTIKVGNVGYDLVGFMSVCVLDLTHS